jgi:mannose/fructose/N-acetylgalactosamine-specific phosphotransferase system component IIC
MLSELFRVALLGGVLAMDRSAGWNLMLGQPLVGACLAGALLNPGPQWELWALRIPLGVGVLLQLLLTDPSLPAAQRPRDTATAGVIGASVALLGVERFPPLLPLSTGGILWVLIGTTAGLLASVAGGRMEAPLRARNQASARRADELAQQGNLRGFESLYWRGVTRVFLRGAAWSAAATVAGVAATAVTLPRLARFVTGPRAGLIFAVLLGAALGAGFHTHVRTPRHGLRWAAIGALATIFVLLRLRGAEP